MVQFNKKKIRNIILIVGTIAILLFSGFNIYVYTTKDTIQVQSWLTVTESENIRILNQADIEMKPHNGISLNTIYVDDNEIYQEMQGFGAALTDSSAWLIHEVLNETEYNKTMKKLFDPDEGIGISFLRITMGASDCSRDFYSYDDTAPNLDDFSILYDESYLIPTLKDAIQLNPSLKIIASPWSAPGWMKIENNLTNPATKGLIGGRLNPDMYDLYAQYFVKYIQAFSAHGIELDSITLQNEQYYVPSDYPGMSMNVTETLNFVKILGNTFNEAELKTKIFILDHNWVYYNEVLDILSDDNADTYIDGVAWHGYGDAIPEKQSTIHKEFPSKSHYFTEVSPLSQYTSFPHNMAWTYHNIYVGSIRNWAEAVILWNLALDDKGGPILNGGTELRGVLTIPQDSGIQTGEVVFDGEYYMIGHLSKFVKNGSYRIHSTNKPDKIETIAFKNPDGSKVLVICNPTDEIQSFKVFHDFRAFNYELSPRSLVTFKWV